MFKGCVILLLRYLLFLMMVSLAVSKLNGSKFILTFHFLLSCFSIPEVMTYSCFIDLMKRMSANFPNGGAMDAHFNNLRSLIQVLDYEVFELMHANGDYTHFYFCYRWFLLDFKRGQFFPEFSLFHYFVSAFNCFLPDLC
jgi:hypothetical protein